MSVLLPPDIILKELNNKLLECVQFPSKCIVNVIEPEEVLMKHLYQIQLPNDFLKDLSKYKWKLIGKSDSFPYTFKLYLSSFECLIKINVLNTIPSEEPKHFDNREAYMKFMLANVLLKYNHHGTELPLLNIQTSNQSKHLIDKLKSFNIDLPSNKFIQIHFSEKFGKTQTLYDFLSKAIDFTINDMKVLLFYIFYTLYIIRLAYPKFKHNRINTNTIYLYLIERNLNKTQEYIIKNNKYYNI